MWHRVSSSEWKFDKKTTTKKERFTVKLRSAGFYNLKKEEKKIHKPMHTHYLARQIWHHCGLWFSRHRRRPQAKHMTASSYIRTPAVCVCVCVDIGELSNDELEEGDLSVLKTWQIIHSSLTCLKNAFFCLSAFSNFNQFLVQSLSFSPLISLNQ